MSAKAPEDLCLGCVYFPPNLPRQSYAEEDWQVLQARACAFEHLPGTAACLDWRKTRCDLVDLQARK